MRINKYLIQATKILKAYRHFLSFQDKVLYISLTLLRFVILPLQFANYVFYTSLLFRMFSYFFHDSLVVIENKKFKLQNGGDFFILTSEEELKQYIPKKGRIFIDIGAHIGKYSILFGDRFEKVLAIEPDPVNFSYLQENVRLNLMEKKIETINLALASQDNQEILLYKQRFNLGAHTIVPITPKEKLIYGYRDELSVRATTLDKLLLERRIPSSVIDFIKIDVEGAEVLVFQGMANTLKNSAPMILYESLSHNRKQVEWCKNFLKSLGFTIKQISSDYYLATKEERKIS